MILAAGEMADKLSLNLDNLKFGGLANQVAETEFVASFNDNRVRALKTSAVEEYRAAGKSVGPA